MEKSSVLIVLMFAALATGGLLVNWIGLGRAMSRLSVSAYVEFHQHTNRTFVPYMPIVVIGALAGGVALAVMYGVHSIPGQLAAAGALCYALVLIISLSTDVRINHQIYSEPAARMDHNTCAMDPVSCHSNVILRSRVRHLSSSRDVKYQPSIMVMIDTSAESRRLTGGFRSRLPPTFHLGDFCS
jgi:hypothetical protein